MTTFDRFERNLPDLLAELGGADATDLVADVLSATSTMRQRPGWRSAERWLPDTWSASNVAPVVHGSRRLLFVVALLLAALLAVAVGSALAPRPTPVPWLTTYRGVFEPAEPIANGLSLSLLAALPDGRVLVVAGDHNVSEGESPPRLPMSIWDPATGGLAPGGIMAAARGASPVVLDDGRVLLIGGDHVLDSSQVSGIGPSTAELYDPRTGASVVTAPMTDSRWLFGVTKLLDGRVLIAGGLRPPADAIDPLASAETFDPATGAWTASGPMTVGRVGPSMAMLTDGRVLVIGGSWGDTEPQLGSADTFDPGTGRFTPTGELLPIPADPANHKYPVSVYAPVVALEDGRALVPGLRCQEVHDIVDGASAGYAPTPAQLFDPASGTFRPAGFAPHCVSTAIGLPNGQVFVAGWWYRGVGSESAGPTRWSGLYDAANGGFREIDAAPVGPYGQTLMLPDGRVIAIQDTSVLILH